MKSITIHQPDHLPYPGFFSKVLSSNTYLILDHVQYKKGNFQNRNKIIDKHKNEKWVTLPIQKMPLNTPINKINLSSHPKMIETYLNSLYESYENLSNSREILSYIEDTVKTKSSLSEINIQLVKYILIDLFEYKGEILLSSSMQVDSKKSDLILDLCREIGANTYLSGPSGRSYLNKEEFSESNILINFVDYKPYEFTSGVSPFLSVIDPLIRYGKDKVKEIILNNTVISTT